MIEIIISGVSGILVGVYLGLKYSNYLFSKVLNDKNKKVKDTFDKVFGNLNEVSFNKRVNNYVYLLSKEITVLIDLKKNVIYLSRGDEFLTDSRHLDENLSNKLLKNINAHFYNDINDVIVLGEYLFSRNLSSITFESHNSNEDNQDEDLEFESEFESVKFNVDMLLDKINSFGISSLTEEEIKFLKNQDE